MERANLIQHYVIKYRTDGPWKTLNKAQIRPEETNYLGKYIIITIIISSLDKIFENYMVYLFPVSIMKTMNTLIP